MEYRKQCAEKGLPTDDETVVRPFFYATCVVALMVAFIAAYLAPDGMRRI